LSKTSIDGVHLNLCKTMIEKTV